MSEPNEIIAKYVNQRNKNPSCRIQNKRYADDITTGKKKSFPEDNIMEDADFDIIKEQLAGEIYKFGLKNLRQWNYRNFSNYSYETFQEDFENLKKFKLDGCRISSNTTIGQKCMDYHTMHLIDKVTNYKDISFEGQYTLANIIIALVRNRNQHSSTYITEILRTIPGVGGSNGFSVTKYKPTMTKGICDYYHARNVLDICVGWGGRPIGTVASGAKYTGIEPATETFDALKHICEDLGITDSVTLFNTTAQVTLPTLKKEYDLAITSPPYFNLEIYNSEESQSYEQGNTWEKWIDNFLTPSVNGVLAVLIDGGISCWSVKNFKSDKQYNLKDVVVELHSKQGWVLQNEVFWIGNKGKKPSEETFIFKKM